ncbi:hypothetical protein GCM10018787_34810 [Streptomyces thermodiastaticus]|nr:hypothetical protein GCM10018787_34810 [Streptomyces thermodiastaticus]
MPGPRLLQGRAGVPPDALHVVDRAQLAGRAKRSAVGEPGSTVAGPRVCPGSSTGVNASWPSTRSPTTGWCGCVVHLAGADVELGDDLLDAIDAVVPPGVDLHSMDFCIEPTPAVTGRRPRRRWERRPPPCVRGSGPGADRSAV